jgi:hypothetical protein
MDTTKVLINPDIRDNMDYLTMNNTTPIIPKPHANKVKHTIIPLKYNNVLSTYLQKVHEKVDNDDIMWDLGIADITVKPDYVRITWDGTVNSD